MPTYGSVCSGIKAASVAWECLGFKPLWFSEIEPFPCAVLVSINICMYAVLYLWNAKDGKGFRTITHAYLIAINLQMTALKSANDCPDTPRYKAIGDSMAVPVI